MATLGQIRFTTGARLNFEFALGDVKILLGLHDSKTKRSKGRPARDLEVFKRAGVILAVTAWETFIEDTLRDQFGDRLRDAQSPQDIQSTFNAVAQSWLERDELKPPDVAAWTLNGWKTVLGNKLEDDLSALNTPNSKNIRKLYKRYLGEDITQSWRWKRVSSSGACKKLDDLIFLRGKLVHRGRELFEEKASVRRGDVVNATGLLEKLVDRTEEKLGIAPRLVDPSS